jgi:U3 small nucleolar RNA-associated protein 21
LEHTLVLPSTAVSITLHRDSGLLAVVCDDIVVRVVDIETRRIVRELGGFRGRVLDIVCYLSAFCIQDFNAYNIQAFSPDSRWLVTASLDSIIRTYDVPTGCLIDAFRTSSVATSIAFSPTNDFLATAHVDSVGVYLWQVMLFSLVIDVY